MDGFTSPRDRKRGISRFLSIRGLGSVEILIFYPSEGSESLFLVFFTHPRPRKASFWQFLLIRGLGRAIFHNAAAMKEKGGLWHFDLEVTDALAFLNLYRIGEGGWSSFDQFYGADQS